MHTHTRIKPCVRLLAFLTFSSLEAVNVFISSFACGLFAFKEGKCIGCRVFVLHLTFSPLGILNRF